MRIKYNLQKKVVINSTDSAFIRFVEFYGMPNKDSIKELMDWGSDNMYYKSTEAIRRKLEKQLKHNTKNCPYCTGLLEKE